MCAIGLFSLPGRGCTGPKAQLDHVGLNSWLQVSEVSGAATLKQRNGGVSIRSQQAAKRRLSEGSCERYLFPGNIRRISKGNEKKAREGVMIDRR